MKKYAIMLTVFMLIVCIFVAPLVINASSCVDDIDGGLVWWFGFYTFCNFTCDTYYHYANAMMNGVYSGRQYAGPGQTATAQSDKAWNADTYNWYYGHDFN